MAWKYCSQLSNYFEHYRMLPDKRQDICEKFYISKWVDQERHLACRQRLNIDAVQPVL
jgi:hypothetical protein